MGTNRRERKHIFICYGSDCKKNGCKAVGKAFKTSIADQKLKSSIRLVKTKCVDYCKKGPNLIISDKIYHKIDPEEVPSIIEKLKE